MRHIVGFGILYTADGARRDGHVIVEDGRVARIVDGPAEDGSAIRVACLVPGLINAHAHFELDASGDTAGYFASTAVHRTVTAVANTLRALESGVTAARDLGSTNGVAEELRAAIDGGQLLGPTIRHAGALLAMTGGHAGFMARIANGPDEIRVAVREQAAAGATWIKMMATGGVATRGTVPGAAQYSFEELQAGVDEAHRRGLRATAHAIGVEGIRNAARAGIDSIEHAHLIDAETARMLVERDIPVVPTLAVISAVAGAGDAVPEHMRAKARDLAEVAGDNLLRARDAGVRFVAGSDSGNAFTPHDGFGRELEAMHEVLGMSGEEVLRAATKDAADLIGVDGGDVVEGGPADLVGYDFDVVASAAFSERPVLVVKGGAVVRS